jgi:hypothetical protein
MGGYFGPALESVFALREVDAKGFITRDGIKTLVSFDSLVDGKVFILGNINLEEFIPQDSILMIDLFLCLAPFTFLIYQLIIDPEGAIAIDLALLLKDGEGFFFINGVEHFNVADFLTLYFDHAVHIVLVGVVVDVFHFWEGEFLWVIKLFTSGVICLDCRIICLD